MAQKRDYYEVLGVGKNATDEELERVYKSYPVIWKNKEATPKLCFIS